MITKEQEQQISRYLLDRKLTLDIAAEVYDHMLMQVLVLMSEGQKFKEAWENTKVSWNEEMKTIYDVWYSFDDITLLMKKLKQKHLKSALKKALPLAFLVWGIHLIVLWSIPKENVEWLQATVCIVYFALLGFWAYQNWDLFRLQRKYINKLSIYHEYVVLPMVLGGFVGWIGNSGMWQKLYDLKISVSIFSFGWNEGLMFGGMTLMMILFYLCIIISAITIRKYRKSIEHIQPFLQKI
ncbi:hypothetical protein KRE40_15155 [Elizabethkingia meningoseptica]|uniref:hypothetical protein n=1 Tax=Elizabethkingia meningoseptica TaxID=238 RepID=UPI0023AEB856|nr:hypothetical protein [Elizabethkingia meningoseptica]MDE5439421.1 hypothetical protein [Elizabethkingia meningoseptica]MDE5509980.1 hypothetical protein [Elizabethkingia meningoseptica]MDE5517116.1 hypothetical protein [Elizabethkingia meningoseptica]MDE5527721.1 hypothetical protein [Elizabethkingia meningoseptica]MDE5531356.1 hypothetical protein [Elizabethkingia meningoseptica]